MERSVCTYPGLRVPGVAQPAARLRLMTVGSLPTIEFMHEGQRGRRVITEDMRQEALLKSEVVRWAVAAQK